ncbi:MAG: flagellar hook-basal body complex protein, partial [Bacteroidales bacterium]|nr:flagellar hook-basal body complex protein [Candidatus Latescibacterota bacterium]
MLRSLFAGVTGLANHQLKLDVIGNNIANINTLGFKASRVTFREMLTQTIRGASRPSEGTGGTNPQQIGLGSSVGSIDTNFSQGNMQITGIMTDLAIEGEGFFVLSDGFNQFYTRGGNFSMDGAGYMVNPGNGYKLQGIIADNYGNIQQGQGVEDIMIPTSLIVPARATSEIEITGNLPGTIQAQGTILRTADMFMSAATGGDILLDLYTGADDYIGLTLGDQINISATVGGTAVNNTLSVTETTSLNDLVTMIQSVLQQQDASAGVNLNADGTIDIAAGAMNIEVLNISVASSYQFNENFLSNFDVDAGEIGTTNIPLRALASEDDLLTEIYVNNVRLPIDEGDLELDGIIGGTDLGDRTEIVDATTTLGDFLDWMEGTYAINGGTVELDNRSRILVTGDIGEAYAIGGIEISQG